LKNCTKCPLHKTRTNVVIGKGKLDAEILIIGEAPGKNEDLEGKPFVGAAGKNLNKFLQTIGLTLDDVYIANILKCRPPDNRNPNIEEIKACTPWLIQQIKDINPKVICPLGNYATKFILSNCNPDEMKKIEGITALHGKEFNITFENQEFKVMPLFHPAAMIYNRKLMPLMDEDLKKVATLIDLEIKEKTQKDLSRF
jgi:uracil-DNA glycosylase